ncbi:MAG TPA: glucosidase [Polyangiaceae bacterium]|nr:glucosidase [Polyangiaceae bacterium]
MRESGAYNAPWRRFGPYLSERQWGTVREDYSATGEAWDYLPHDHARSRAYRWGEDGLLGFSDHHQRICLAPALWNERDPILKERLFGLTNAEGNHGEDVKEQYYYLDATPTASYAKALYKYPQRAFPYAELVNGNRARSRREPELELCDLGVFDDDRYFDVFVEYAKAEPNDILWRVHAVNRGPETAPLHLLFHVWFRNTWSWFREPERPWLVRTGDGTVELRHHEMGAFVASFDGAPELLFCENETNFTRLFGSEGAPFPKDAINDRVVAGKASATNPACRGTKCAAHYFAAVPPGGELVMRGRLSQKGGAAASAPFADFDALFAARQREADDFYAELQDVNHDADARMVQRQALAGMIWSKQFYNYDVRAWLFGDETQPAPPAARLHGRNVEWKHLVNDDVLSMPDKWEYPWYAAWDLAFHCVPIALVDPEFAKHQLVLLTREWYMHPNGQLPAYEWAFGDVNPPVHAWAALRVFQMDRKTRGDAGDLDFLERVFHKLMLNFTWWVNRKDVEGKNVFQGGFLGLDNIGVFDRSKPLPTGGFINQSDGTGWMAMYSLNLMRIALELAVHDPVYEDIASKFFEHFLHIAEAMANIGPDAQGLWDDEDKFYYDVLHVDGRSVPLRIRSMVGLIPLFAVEVLERGVFEQLPGFTRRLRWFLEHRPDLASLVSRWQETATGERHLLSLLRGHRMKKLLARMLDESEFFSPYGVRSLSRCHADKPFVLDIDGHHYDVNYVPGDSETGLFGGNSNWRGPIWMPVNFLLVESLQKFHHYYGDDFKVECPTGSGRFLTLLEIADELSARLTRLFLRDEHGRRPCYGEHPKYANDPHFRDYLLFHEFFHGDSGRGLGAIHQTGWTGLVAKLIQPRRLPSP